MTKLRQESHARMLGNGLCTRPAELDCRMETACETCAYLDRTEFVPSSSANAITPATTVTPTGQPSSINSSTKPPRPPLDTDYTITQGA